MSLLKNLKKSKFIQLIIRIIKIPFFLPYYVIVNYCFKFEILSPDRTASLLNSKNLSVARFGDGEFNIILRDKSIDFQPYSPELKNSLFSTLTSKNVKIALPHGLKSTKADVLSVKSFWWMYVTLHYNEISKFVRKTKTTIFLDTNFSRTVTELKDKNKISNVLFTTKGLWSGKHVVMIEGSSTRFGVGNDLFSKSLSVARIIAPAKDAFSKINEIKKATVSVVNDNKKANGWTSNNIIILIALGPTASVLADQLSGLAQTIDIGHFDLQYEYLLEGAYKPIRIDTRFDNEHAHGDKVIDISDREYLSSIYVDLT